MPSHAERLERYLEKHPGATIQEARGHGKTPEHPGQGKGQERYAEYHERRAEAEQRVNNLKAQAFGASPNYNADSAANTTHGMSLSSLQSSAGYDSLDDYAADMGGWDEIDDGYGYYH